MPRFRAIPVAASLVLFATLVRGQAPATPAAAVAPPPPKVVATPAPATPTAVTPKPAATPVPPTPAPVPKPPAPTATPPPKPATPPATVAPKPPASPAPASPKPATPATPVKAPVASPKPPPASPKPIDKLAEFKTADELWAHFQALDRGPRGQGTTPAERAKAFQEFVIDLRATAELFANKYPTDPRRWEARLTADRLTQRVANAKPQAEVEKLYREAAEAADAPVEIKARARLGLIQMHREALKDDSPKEKVQAVDAEIGAFANDFPKHDAIGQLLPSRAQLWERRDRAKAITILTELTKHANPEVAREATALLRFKNILREPLPLKFTTLDGAEFDLEQLRGKVVLVYFWATTSPPSVAEIPSILAVQEKYRDSGFEVVGISLDNNKDRLADFVREKAIEWPIYFDGKGMRNAISSSYALRTVPVMWLVNKKGFVAFTDARGELEDLVKKLLGEE